MTSRIILTTRIPEMLENPDLATWTYASDQASYPLWEPGCQRRIVLHVKGLHQGSTIELSESKECPSCGRPLRLRVSTANGRNGGHIAERIEKQEAWEAWFGRLRALKRRPQTPSRRAFPLARIAQGAREV